jgi:hypothetical protein
MFKNQFAGFLNLAMTSFIIDTLGCLSGLEINLCPHIQNVLFLDQAVGARAFAQELDACKQNPVVIDLGSDINIRF